MDIALTKVLTVYGPLGLGWIMFVWLFRENTKVRRLFQEVLSRYYDLVVEDVRIREQQNATLKELIREVRNLK